MIDPKSPQLSQAFSELQLEINLTLMWEELLEDRENRRKDEEFWKEVMGQPVFEEWEE